MELTKEQKITIINQKIEGYQAQIYSTKLDLDCAKALEDDQWTERIHESAKRLMQLINVLESELAKVEEK